MTTATARRAPARTPSRRPAAKPRPNLRVVTPVASRAPRAPFVLFSMLLVGSGLVGLLYLHTVVTQHAFTIHDLGQGTAALAEREQVLRQEIADLEAPQDLALKARALGLVPAGDPVFLTPEGKVLGVPVPAATPRPATAGKPAAAVQPKPAAATAKPAAAKPATATKPKPATATKPKPKPKPSAAPTQGPTP